MERLTAKQKKFCEEYLIDSNGTQAAVRAGYSDRTAREQAARMLAKVNIKNYINELQQMARKRTDITKDQILNELGIVVNAKITDYLTFDGQILRFKSLDELSEAQVKAIESIRQTRYGIELKLHGKSWSIDRICKMLGFDAPEKTETNLELIWREERYEADEKTE